MTSLFDNPVSSRNQNKHLVEFRAGKMTMKGNMVHPDRRKGLVYIYQSDDSLMHFCWKDRTTGTVEDDLIIFPDDIEFKHVSQCTTGRVYVLKFRSSSRKLFFWLQEPRTDKDEENCRKVNDFLNNPPTPASSRRSNEGLSSSLPNLGDQDLQSMLGGMSQQQLMQLLNGMGMGGGSSGSGLLESLLGRPRNVAEPPLLSQPAVARAAPGEATSSLPRPEATSNTMPKQQTAGSGRDNTSSGVGATSTSAASRGAGTHIQLSDLQNILSTMTAPKDGTEQEGLDLAKTLNPEAMMLILVNPEIQRQLTEFLPEGESLPKTEEELRNSMHSAQFQQVLRSFSAALQSGQLGPLMSQFGLGEDVVNAATQGDMEAFVKAMQEATKKKDEDKNGEDQDDATGH